MLGLEEQGDWAEIKNTTVGSGRRCWFERTQDCQRRSPLLAVGGALCIGGPARNVRKKGASWSDEWPWRDILCISAESCSRRLSLSRLISAGTWLRPDVRDLDLSQRRTTSERTPFEWGKQVTEKKP